MNNFGDNILLTIDDNINKLIINVDKNILIKSCNYFENLFLKFVEKDMDNITIKVPNCQVTYDIIQIMHGNLSNSMEDWKYILESYKCHDYLNLKFDLDKLYNLKVPEEAFDELLNIVDMIGYNDNTINLLNKNLPMNYNLDQLPLELVKQMLEYCTTYNIIYMQENNALKIFNYHTNDVVKILFKTSSYCVNKGEIILKDQYKVISIYSSYGVLNKILIKECEDEIYCCAHNGEYLVLHNKNQIKIFDLKTKKIIDIIDFSNENNIDNHLKIYKSPNDNFIMIHDKKTLKIFDFETLNISQILTTDDEIIHLSISPDSNDFAIITSINNRRIFNIYNIKSNNIIYSHDYRFVDSIMNLDYSPLNNNLIICKYNYAHRRYYLYIFDIVKKYWTEIASNVLTYYKIIFLPNNEKFLIYELHSLYVCDYKLVKRINTISYEYDLYNCIIPDTTNVLFIDNINKNINIWNFDSDILEKSIKYNKKITKIDAIPNYFLGTPNKLYKYIQKIENN
ncbi:BTB/POZ domain-containing protein [Megavirus baoshan]|uniref:Putative BTB/POZ domain-containing protein n=1 Tax=Megavirus baoshan TaxID=2496520 RepID=A0A3Q8U7R5_9VIRU|nr:BTB/POZ domain-containing protein [Megavirus baoshan]AZL89211.1 BTB/POZ domain-containing protein [Megavirus baoshan]